MNWLAHIVLAGPDGGARLGGVLADLVPMALARELPGDIRRGIALHHAIDAFSDAHPAVCASSRRISAGGVGLRPAAAAIAVDMLYDHLLARDWERSGTGVELAVFARDFYTLADARASELPARARAVLGAMGRQDWLGSYRDLPAIRTALERIRLRLSPRAAALCPLAAAVDVFIREREAFEEDFARFWPEVTALAGGFAREENAADRHF